MHSSRMRIARSGGGGLDTPPRPDPPNLPLGLGLDTHTTPPHQQASPTSSLGLGLDTPPWTDRQTGVKNLRKLCGR